jgi:hypothetical protein
MIRSLATAVILTLVTVSSAHAQLRLGWNACSGDAASTSQMTFSCDATVDTVYRIVATFSLPREAKRVVTLDGTFDFVFPKDRGVPPFWHFEPGGCNQGGLILSDARPHSGCAGQSNSLCGPGGAACDAIVTAYAPGHGGSDRARMLVAVVRPSVSPVNLAAAPASHFGFEVLFSMDRSDSTQCEGCSTPTSIRWTEAKLYSVDESGEHGGEIVHLTCQDGGDRAVVTLGGATKAACDTTAAPNH